MIIDFYVFGERIIFSSSSQPWPNNQHFNAYQYIHIRACFFTWGKVQGVPDASLTAKFCLHHKRIILSNDPVNLELFLEEENVHKYLRL